MNTRRLIWSVIFLVSDYATVDLSDVIENRIRYRRETKGDGIPCDLKDVLNLPITYKNNKKTLKLVKDIKHSPDRIPALALDANGHLTVTNKKKKYRVGIIT